MTTYCCTLCRVEKPADMFYTDKRTAKGVTSRCKDCLKALQKEISKRHVYSERDYLRAKAWTEANREKVRVQCRAKRAKNPDAYRKATREWELRYPERKARYRRGKRLATPAFANKEMMRVVMKKARELGLEVDHVVPIVHPLVSGLHCWHNLQLLDKSLNSSKQNKWWPDMPDFDLQRVTV